jgi:hypothetical protein
MAREPSAHKIVDKMLAMEGVEEDDALGESPLRQSCVRSLTEPSAHIIDAIVVGIEVDIKNNV